MTIASRFIRRFACLASAATTPAVGPFKHRRAGSQEEPHETADLYDWEDECGRLTASEAHARLARSPGAVESNR